MPGCLELAVKESGWIWGIIHILFQRCMMLLKQDGCKETGMLDDWPKHFYEVEDAALRRKALFAHMKTDPGSKGDDERMKVLDLRYDENGNDLFMRAWMLLKMKENEGRSFFFRKRQTDEVRACLHRLGILDAEHTEQLHREWQAFSGQMIRRYAASPAYRAAAFGMARVSEENTARRIAHEIIQVTDIIPKRYGFAAEMEEFRAVFRNAYFSMIESGARFWAEETEKQR